MPSTNLDKGGTLDLGEAHLQFIPAHYLHSFGNFHLYDAEAKSLTSDDIKRFLDWFEELEVGIAIA